MVVWGGGGEGFHPVPVLCPLPEFPGISPREHGGVLLGLVAKNGGRLVLDVSGSEGDGHLDLVGVELLPCPSVQPHLAGTV